MSYSIYLTFKDGKPIVNASGDIPEGMWQIGGHEDDFGQGINVCHKDLNGLHIAEAHHHRSTTMYDEAQFVGASTDDLPTRLMRLGFTAEQAEHYLLDLDEPMPSPAPEVESIGRFQMPTHFKMEGGRPVPVEPPVPVHIHDDDGTVEGCPGCFYDPAIVEGIPEPTGEMPEVPKDYGDDAPLTDKDLGDLQT